MRNLRLSPNYLKTLRRAAKVPEVNRFVCSSLGTTLAEIELSSSCVRDVLQLTQHFGDPKCSLASLGDEAEHLLLRWSRQLDRVYRFGYEFRRKAFFDAFVFPEIRALGPSHVLDVGCGRGWVSYWLVREGICSAATGIDAREFGPDWEDVKSLCPDVSFCSVDVDQISAWLEQAPKPDVVLLSWVLHHSPPSDVVATLKALRTGIPGVRIVVIEDTGFPNQACAEDPHGFGEGWSAWLRSCDEYRLSCGWSVQALLDFVAVQILARYSDVSMPCNYQRSSDWVSLFDHVGFHVTSMKYIGFPEGRDIAVPQGLFILEPKHEFNQSE